MRWDAQRLDLVEPEALPGLPTVAGLLRSLQVPEFPGLTLHEVRAKSALNKVPADSAMPFAYTVNTFRGCSHACVYCVSPETRILMADGRTRPIVDVRVGDKIVGTETAGSYRRYTTTEVLAHWRTQKPGYRVRLHDGTELIASGDHRFLTDRGWKHVTGATSGAQRRPHLTTGVSLLGFGRTEETRGATPDYRLGYLTGMVRGDAHMGRYATHDKTGREGIVHQFRLALADIEALDRCQDMLSQEGIATKRFDFSPATDTRRPMAAIRTQRRDHYEQIKALISYPEQATPEWDRGFLAGIFDAEGSRSIHVLRIANCDPELLARTEAAFHTFGFDVIREDRHRPDGLGYVRLRGGLREHMRFIHLVDPAIRRKCAVAGIAIKSDADLRVASVESIGLEMPMYDITTGTGDFIANGVVSHNCFARKTHEWLELDSGADFDQEIVVKTNIADVLRRELGRASWKREHVALGTNTDPYQRAEGRYRLMPGVIEALARSGTPFSILTKGTLARRDLPLLAAASKDVPIGMGVSLAIWDDDLHRSLEPGVPTPKARLELVRQITDAGLPCGVFLAPVLPGLTDQREHLERAIAAVAEAGASGVTVVPLHLRPGAREWFTSWLSREHPRLVSRYKSLYGRGAYLPAEYRDWLSARVAPLLAAHGLDRHSGGAARGIGGLPGDESASFPFGSLPGPAAVVEPRDEPEQLALC